MGEAQDAGPDEVLSGSWGKYFGALVPMKAKHTHQWLLDLPRLIMLLLLVFDISMS